MKKIIIAILGWISLVAGVLFSIVTLILLFGSKANVAGILFIPDLALLIAAANLLTYGKQNSKPDPNRLSKE